MSHTPGPHTQEIFYNKMGSMGAVVCSCGFATTFTVMHDQAEKAGREFFIWMHDDHARLIAAAPGLLKTLQFIASIFEGGKIDGHDNCRCLVCEAIPTECARAIAKATGTT